MSAPFSDANAFGANVPLDDLSEVVRALGIADGDRVLDVGGGANPLPRADVVCDLTFASCAQRNGAQGVLRADVEYVEGPAEKLPFDDNAFDFVWCSQTLEHVVDPEAACRELARVARRGFVEVPSRAGEMVNGNPTHRWIIDRDGDTLVFHPRPFVEHPMGNAWYGLLFSDDDLHTASESTYRNVFNHQVRFEGILHCRVVQPDGDCFNYDDPGHAARAHYDFARNTLRAGAPAEYAFPDALEAARLIPQSLPALLLKAAYQTRLLRLDDARSTLDGLDHLEANALRALIQRIAAGAAIDLKTVPLPGPDPFRGSDHGLTSEQPLVSIIVVGSDPVAVAASTEAALTQDYGHSEVVVASAGAVAEEIGRLHMPERLHLHVFPPETPIGALYNRGAEHAKGEIITFLQAGDRPLAHHIERAVAHLAVAGIDAVYSDRLLRDGTLAGPDIEPGNPATAAASLSTVVARRSALERVGWFDESADEGTTDPGFDYLNRLATALDLEHLREATIESPHDVPEGAQVLDVARAQGRLRPLELHRSLIAAADREAGLRERIAKLEARLKEIEGGAS